MESEKFEVRFDIYCPKCKHSEDSEELDPCDECLAQPWNYNSQKPINFKQDK